MMPKISVIAALYNHEKYVRFAIESVLKQTYKDWELIIWDDGSRDQSLHIAREYAEKYPQQIKVFTHENHANKGQEYTRNKAIEQAQGEWLSLLDTDDYYVETKFEKLSIAFTRHEVGMCFGRAEIFNEKNNKRARQVSSFPKSESIFGELIYDNFIFAGSTLFRKSFFEKGFRFDDSFKTCGEYPLWLQIAARSKVLSVEDVVCGWRSHAGNLGKKHELLAKKELTKLKEKFRNDPAYQDFLMPTQRALAKSYYDYASLLYRDHQFDEAKSYWNLVVSDASAAPQLKNKAEVMLMLLNKGRRFNKAFSYLKNAVGKIRRRA